MKIQNPRIRKFAYLFIGILIGLSASLSYIWWKDNSYKEWRFLTRINNYISNIFTSSNKENNEQIENNNQEAVKIKRNKSLKYNSDSSYFDTTSSDRYDASALDEYLSTNHSANDTFSFDTTQYTLNNNQSVNELVMKDKLMATKIFNLHLNDAQTDRNNKLDSLLTDNKTNQSATTKVEFWKSPINYKGYKYGGGRIIIFGVLNYTLATVLSYNKTTYLKYNGEYYPLETTAEFRPLLPIGNQNLISQLNKVK